MPLLFIAVAFFLFCFHRIKLHIDKPVGYGKIYLSEKSDASADNSRKTANLRVGSFFAWRSIS